MKHTHSRSLAANSLLLAVLIGAVGAHAARRPRYGGTLRVEIGPALASLDPAVVPANETEAAAKEKLLALVFDRLVTLDDHGDLQPGLATSWQSSADFKTWTFRLRPNVQLHTGAMLSPNDLASVLRSGNPSWRVDWFIRTLGGVRAEFLTIDPGQPAPDLPYELASPRNFIYTRGADGAPVGSGPFKITTWEAGTHAVLTAFEDHWKGRPFLDLIDIQMARPIKDRLIDLEVGKTDLIDIPPQEARRAMDRGARVIVSQPDELLALVFLPGRPGSEDARLREALADSIDRDAVVAFILQKQGIAAGSLLPQWSSGTAVLFSPVTDPTQAKDLVSQIRPDPVIVVGYDSADPLAKSVAERIELNAHDSGLAVRAEAMSASANATQKLDAILVRVPMKSPLPRPALTAFLAVLGPLAGLDATPLPESASPEEIYDRERSIVDGQRVVPLLYLPEISGVSPRVKDWFPPLPASGNGWPLANVWLEEVR